MHSQYLRTFILITTDFILLDYYVSCVSNIHYIRTCHILVTIILMDGSHWIYIRLEDVWRADQNHWAHAHVFETPQWWCSTTLIVCERICVRVCVCLCKYCLKCVCYCISCQHDAVWFQFLFELLNGIRISENSIRMTYEQFSAQCYSYALTHATARTL